MTNNRPRVRFRVRRATADVPVTHDTETKAPVCPLCGGPGPLRISHIIPKFAFEWLKDTSATGFMRHGPHPNLRVQDGFKKELLCDSCEQLLAGWEDVVAAQLFRPYNEGSKVTITYEEWLAKFAASLVWRVLFVMKAEGLKNLSDSQLQLAGLALEVWRKFIRGERDNPGSFELHLLPVDFIDASKNNSLPANFNRYLIAARRSVSWRRVPAACLRSKKRRKNNSVERRNWPSAGRLKPHWIGSVPQRSTQSKSTPA